MGATQITALSRVLDRRGVLAGGSSSMALPIGVQGMLEGHNI
jgi:hypothetical protein